MKVKVSALKLDSLAKGNGVGLPCWRFFVPIFFSIYLCTLCMDDFLVNFFSSYKGTKCLYLPLKLWIGDHYWKWRIMLIMLRVLAGCYNSIQPKSQFSFVLFPFRHHLSGQKNGSKNFKHKVAFYTMLSWDKKGFVCIYCFLHWLFQKWSAVGISGPACNFVTPLTEILYIDFSGREILLLPSCL